MEGEPVKSHKALGILAVASLVVGLVLWAFPYPPRVYHGTFGLLAGSTICPGLPFATGAAGNIRVVVNATPGTVIQYVMTEDQFVASEWTGRSFRA